MSNTCTTRGLTVASKVSHLGQEKVYQFRSGNKWIDYRGYMWSSYPPNERRVIWRDIPPHVSHPVDPLIK